MKNNIRGFKNTLRLFYFVILTHKYKWIYSLRRHYFYLPVARDDSHFLLKSLMNYKQFRIRRLSSLYFISFRRWDTWSESCGKIFWERSTAYYHASLFSRTEKNESCRFSLSSVIIHDYIFQVRFMMV